MNPKKIFICSTCHDFKDLRAELKDTLEDWGYEPVLSEYSEVFPVKLGTDLYTACVEVVKKSDILILIMGKRYDGRVSGKNISITELEYNTAVENGIPRINFCLKEVWHQYRIWKENPNIKFPKDFKDGHEVMKFLGRIRKVEKGKSDNWIHQFETSVDIKDILKTQLGVEDRKLPTKSGKLVPYNLPRAHDLVGRDNDIDEMIQALISSYTFVVIEGLGGIGKTGLAATIANKLWEDRQFEQVIWVSAKERSINLSTLLDEVSIAIDYPYISQLPLDRKTLEAARLLRNIRCLLVIDNFDTITDDAEKEISSFLLTLPAPSKALVTSRPPLPGEQLISSGAFIYHLEGLGQEASISLMIRESRRLGVTSIRSNQNGHLTELYEITGGNPLAIILSIGQMKQTPYSLETIISNLRKAKDNLFQEIFGMSWTLLGENAKALLKATSLFASSFSKDALVAVQKLSTSKFDAAFSELLCSSLIESNNALTEAELRFNIHPLTKVFAESKLDESDEEKMRINLTLAKYFLEFAQRYEIRFWEGREIYGYLEMERLNILSTMDWCWDATQFEIFAELARAIADFFIVRGHWQLCLTYGNKAAKAAYMVGDKDLQAWVLVHMQGYLYANRYEFDMAERILSKALELYRQTKNNPGTSETLRNLARVYRKKGNFDRARNLYEECHQIALATGDKKRIALALNEIGKLERDQCNLSQAIELFNSAKREVEDVDNSIYAGILCNMAGVAVDLGDLESARKYSLESLRFFAGIDNKEGIATTKWRLAEIELFQNSEHAKKFANESYEIFSRLGMKQECLELQKIISHCERILKGENH